MVLLSSVVGFLFWFTGRAVVLLKPLTVSVYSCCFMVLLLFGQLCFFSWLWKVWSYLATLLRLSLSHKNVSAHYTGPLIPLEKFFYRNLKLFYFLIFAWLQQRHYIISVIDSPETKCDVQYIKIDLLIYVYNY